MSIYIFLYIWSLKHQTNFFPGKMKKVKLNCHFGICTAVDPKIWDTCNYVCNAELGKHTAC